jgi:hypothetical protein
MMNNIGIDELASSPESKTLKFKRDLSSPKPLLKTLIAFASSAGGNRSKPSRHNIESNTCVTITHGDQS